MLKTIHGTSTNQMLRSPELANSIIYFILVWQASGSSKCQTTSCRHQQFSSTLSYERQWWL